jgi:hypothetical protein
VTSSPSAAPETVLILGGSGLVGYQVAQHVARQLRPQRIVIVALHRREVRDAVDRLRRIAPGVTFDGYYGDVFGRGDPIPYMTHVREDRLYRGRDSAERRDEIFRDTFVDFEDAYRKSMLVRLLFLTRPTVLVDCVNTATAISYQDVHSASRNVMASIERYQKAGSYFPAALTHGGPAPVSSPANAREPQDGRVQPTGEDVTPRVSDSAQSVALGSSARTATTPAGTHAALASAPASASLRHAAPASAHAEYIADAAEKLVASLSTPQLILHVRLLERAFREVGTRVYLKVGTTGTGGMGLNIPYTHGEDRPSPTLMTKTAIGFAHTGLLFLLARTPGMPIVKEIKPAAMIGYRAIALKTIRGRVYKRITTHDGPALVPVQNQPLVVTRAIEQPLGSVLDTTPRLDLAPVTVNGKPRRLELPCVDTGENGLFTRGEFEAITSLGQMEYVTPEEIAELVVLEIRGANTGKDVIGAIDSSVLDPSYRAGFIRPAALSVVEALERDSGVPSIALGRLGPPQLAKLLYEAHLLATVYGTLPRVLGEDDGDAPAPEEMSETLFAEARTSGVADVAATLGIPLLVPDGSRLLRGPAFRMPEYNALSPQVDLTGEQLKFYAERAWIDLRPANMRRWIERLRQMRRSAYSRRTGWASEHLTREGYPFREIRIGAVVAWIFANEMEGYRIA